MIISLWKINLNTFLYILKIFLKFYLFLIKFFQIKNKLIRLTKISELGYESQTPFNLKFFAIKNASGTKIIKPLDKEIIWESFTFSIDAKNVDVTIFIPMKGHAKKYNTKPSLAYLCEIIFPSSL